MVVFLFFLVFVCSISCSFLVLLLCFLDISLFALITALLCFLHTISFLVGLVLVFVDEGLIILSEAFNSSTYLLSIAFASKLSLQLKVSMLIISQLSQPPFKRMNS